MLLMNGVTGFYTNDMSPSKWNDGKSFKQIAYTSIRKHKGEIIVFTEPDVQKNFYHILSDFSGESLHILLNGVHPLLAFAKSVEHESIDFINEPVFLKDFHARYNVLTVDDLYEPIKIKRIVKDVVELENPNQLNKAELKQIAYWKPKYVGEVLFNYWD